jgi:hypothetical protein
MITQAAKELFALINLACGGAALLALAVYLLFSRERRPWVAAVLALLAVLAVINSLVVYFLA